MVVKCILVIVKHGQLAVRLAGDELELVGFTITMQLEQFVKQLVNVIAVVVKLEEF